MKNETYKQLKARQQAEVNAFDMKFAFSRERFAEIMSEWGLTVNDTDKIARIPAGGFILKENVSAFLDMVRRHKEERDAARAADKTGNGYLYQMFYAELINHEYGYTGDEEETVESLGYTLDEVYADPIMAHALAKAKKAVYALDW